MNIDTSKLSRRTESTEYSGVTDVLEVGLVSDRESFRSVKYPQHHCRTLVKASGRGDNGVCPTVSPSTDTARS